MSERKIDLDKLIGEFAVYEYIDEQGDNMVLFLKKYLKESYFEFGKQLLELAAENAEITRKDYFEATIEEAINGFDVYHNWDTDDCPSFVDIINVDSILNTIKQVE